MDQLIQPSQNAHETNPREDELSLLDLLATLLRHKKLIILITVGAALAALVYAVGSLLLPPEKTYLPNVFTSRASILISSGQSGGLSGALASSGLGGLAAMAGVSVGGASSGELAVFLAKSVSSLDELNEEFDFTAKYKIETSVRTETRNAILAKLSISFDKNTGIMSLSFEDSDPDLARRVVNRLVEILDRRFAALGGNKARNQKMLLEQKLADVQGQMTRIEGEIKVFQKKYGVLSVEALATEQIAILARLRSELIMKDIEIENYEKFSKIDDPVIRRLRSERQSILNKTAELERGGSILPTQKEIPELAFEYAALQRDMLVQTEIFKILTQQYELAKLNSEGQEAAFQVIELGETADKKSGPSRAMLCIVTTMAAFFLSVLAAFLIEAIKTIGKNPEAMAKLRGKV
jgi:tyrosine-protein kinase Etk/Wzc